MTVLCVSKIAVDSFQLGVISDSTPNKLVEIDMQNPDYKSKCVQISQQNLFVL